MKTNLDKILEGAVFDDEIKSAIKEAWDKKVSDITESLKKDIEKDVRSELKEMYKNDSNNLIESMNSMLSEAVETYSKEQIEAAKKLEKEKEKVASELAKERKESKEKIDEKLSVLEGLILSELSNVVSEKQDEINSLRAERVKLVKETKSFKEVQKTRVSEAIDSIKEKTKAELESKKKELEVKKEELEDEIKNLKDKIKSHKDALTEATKAHLSKFDLFATKKLKEELTEFAEDKKALNERRVSFELEAKKKLEETKNRFVSASKELVARTVHKALTEELAAIKEEIKEARENDLGREIFESFKKTFIKSGLTDKKSELFKLQETISDLSSKLEESKKEMASQKVLLEQADLAARKARNEAIRTKTLGELLRPLNKSKREIMENLLANTKTEKLEESFTKLLPSVMNDVVKESKATLNETKTVNSSRVITGDKPTKEKNTLNEERKELLRLAGIIKE